MSGDLRERLAAAIREARFDEDDYANEYTLAEALRPLIEAELATVRRDWLGNFRDAVTKCARERGVENVYAFLNEYLPADLAADLAAHDARIRREAYLRCANAASERDHKLATDFENVKNEPSLTYMFDKWAEEADGGG